MITNENPQLETSWNTACDELSLEGSDPRDRPNANRSFLRLKRRLPELTKLIESRINGGDLIPEKYFTTPDGLFRGQPDLIVNGPLVSLIDYKSGSVLKNGEIKREYKHQLLFYSYLIQKSDQLNVNEAWLFSLIDGLIKVNISVDQRDTFIKRGKEAIAAYNEKLPEAPSGSPSKDTCKWCAHINKCDSVWASFENGEIKDFDSYHMVEGTVTSTPEDTNNGKSTVLVSVSRGTTSGDIIVSSIPRNIAEVIEINSSIRISRLQKAHQEVATFSWKDGDSMLSIQD